MSSPAPQSTPDDVPALRLPMQELTQTMQAAAMLVSALRSRRQELGVRAWHPHEDAAREHDVAESPPVTQPSAQDHAHRWAHAAASEWGSGNVAAQPDTWLQPDPRVRGELQALWTVASELEQRGYSPAEVLAGVSAPESVMRPTAGEDEGASRPGASELAQQAAYVATERGVITADWLARDLGVEHSSAVRLVEALERDGLVGPADGRQHPALVRRSDVDTYLGLRETEPTRAWRTELAQAAEHAGTSGSVSTGALQRSLDVDYPRATNLLDGLSAAGVVAEEAGDTRTALVSSPEQARGQLGQPPAGLSPSSSASVQDPELLARAGQLVTSEQWGSTRMLQRRLQITPDEAVSVMNALEAHQIVGPADEHGRARTVHAQPGEVASLLGHATTPASSSTSTTSTQRPAAANQPSPQQASGPSLG